MAKEGSVKVTIRDIKPGSFPNSINVGAGGNVPVAIFSSSTFDATTVDPTTVTLASAPDLPPENRSSFYVRMRRTRRAGCHANGIHQKRSSISYAKLRFC